MLTRYILRELEQLRNFEKLAIQWKIMIKKQGFFFNFKNNWKIMI